MGITNLLPSLGSISHKVKLTGARHYKVPLNKNVTTSTSKNDNAASEPKNPPLSMLELLRNMVTNSNEKHNEKNTDHGAYHDIDVGEDMDRHLRIGVDISTWISAACHGNGAELIDERHFSRHGRHELAQQAASSANVATVDANNIPSTGTRTPQQSASDQQQQQVQNFIKIATESVLRKIKSIQYLLSPQVIVVLDGASPPIKKNVVEERQKSRSEAARQRDALHVLNEDTARNQRRKIGTNDHINPNITADQCEDNANIRKISSAKKAGAHTSQMYAAVVRSVLRTLREHEITFLVAPYEADGQLTYLSQHKYIDFIVSEDSDFIPCGAEAILYKYKADIPFEAGFDGKKNAKKYGREAFQNATATATLILPNQLAANTSTSFSLLGFTDVMFAILCVAAGCDYAPSLKGIGLVHARNAVDDAFSDESKYTLQGTKLEKVWKGLFARCYGTLSQEEKTNYRGNFIRALVMFRHPVVFCPISVKCVFANINSPDAILMEYGPYADIVKSNQSLQNVVGEILNSEMVIYIAEGWINPKVYELRYEEQETPGHIVDYLRRWKDAKAQKQFQMECDLINGTQSQQSQDADRSGSVAFTSPTPPSASKSTQNPSQSTTGTQGSRQSNVSADIMSPELLV